jgi:molybdenum cofactor biosynthesis protein B
MGHHHEKSPAAEHKAGKISVTVQVITVSDTRGPAEDKSGALLAELFRAAGHTVRDGVIVKDDAGAIRGAITAAEADDAVRAIVINGGTGVAKRDVTVETVTPLLEKVLPGFGFGEIFRQLSFAEIGAAAILSRAVAGTRGKRVVFALPGSSNAVRLAAEKLILPELVHLVRELDK